MKRKSLLLMMLLAFAMPWAAMAQFSGGSGTASDPYQIANAADWNTLANGISSYKSSHFIMTDDITTGVTTMVGTSSNRFQGTFNGGGHTLTVDLSGISEQGVAPFQYIEGATIKNLKVEGSVTATQHHASGLVGFAWSGINTIENCLVSTNVTNTENDNYIGGIVGHGKGSTVKILGCVYNGTLKSSGKVGGLLGWADGGIHLYVYNSLFNGNTENNSSNFHPIAFRNGSVQATAYFNNCYYTKDSNFIETNQTNNLIQSGSDYATVNGTSPKHCYSIGGGSNVTVALTGNTPANYGISGITGYTNSYEQQNSGISYNGTIYAGNNDAVSLLLSYTGSNVLESYNPSSGNFSSGSAITGSNDAYTLTMPSSDVTINATTTAQPVLHDSDGTYMTWAQFAANVMNNVNYSSKTVYLDADVTVTEPIGIQNAASGNGDHFFNGTFDGQGHTVTLNMTATRTMYGLFAVLNSAIVQNLIIDGSISNTSYAQIGGLAGYTLNTCTITNCLSNVSISSSKSGDMCGGFIAEMGGDSKVTFSGCAFTGTLDAQSNCGGFVGKFLYNSNNHCELHFNDCLFTSTNSSCGTSNKAPFSYNTQNPDASRFTISNSYYTTAFGTSQGKQAHSIMAGTDVTVSNAGIVTNYDASGITGYGTGIKYNNVLYAGNGDQVSLNLGYTGDGTLEGFVATPEASITGSGPYTLTMPSSDVTINATATAPPVLHDSDGNYMTWAQFAANVMNNVDYSGKTVYLDADVTVTEPIGIQNAASGNGDHFFNGTFDGQGHTVTLDMTATRTMYGLFAVLDGITVKNLIIDGSISNTSYAQIGGLAGYTLGTCTITNCLSNVSISSSKSDDICGGFIAEMGGDSKVTFNGCAFTGTLTAQNNCGGFVGFFNTGGSSWAYDGTLSINNSIFASANSTATSHCGNFTYINYNRNLNIDNSYYTTSFGAEQGKQAHSIMAGTDVTVSNAGTVTNYDASGITGYGTGIKYNNVLYAGSGDNVSLTLSNSNTGKYYASAGTLSGSTLTMPAENVTISDAMVLVNASGNTWNNANHWSPSRVPTADDAVTIYYNVTIPANCVAKANYINVTDNAVLTIADGGQLFCNSEVTATVQKNIAKHGANAQEGGWNFIASPIVEGTTPSTTNGILSSNENDYDLFFYDEPTHYWRNYKYNDGNNTSHGFNLRNGQGYLYANAANTTLSFTGTLVPSTTAVEKPLSFNSTAGDLAGWNLVGNPFACNATVTTTTNTDSNSNSCYVINGGAIVATTGTVAAPCSGVMVKADATGQTVTFTPTTNAAVFSTGHNQLNVTIANNMTARGEGSMIDNAIVSFNENSQLEKFVFFEDNAKLYIPQGEKDYAIVSAEAQGEMPVCFKATKDGEYTITVSPEGVELNYLHLIDNMTGMDVDLLQTPSYTFEASTRDYESRFKLVFAGASTDSATDESFAYYDGSEWKVSNEGEATLQVVDVIGRIVKSETINGNFNLNLNQKAGVYMLRLVNGENVKVQKVVVR